MRCMQAGWPGAFRAANPDSATIGRMTDRANPFLGHEHRRPDVDAGEAARLLEAAFGRRGIVRELGSHQDRNFLVAGDGGARFVFKIARHGLSRAPA